MKKIDEMWDHRLAHKLLMSPLLMKVTRFNCSLKTPKN